MRSGWPEGTSILFIRIKVFNHSNCDMEEEYVNSPIGYGTTVVTVVMEDMKGLHFMICS